MFHPEIITEIITLVGTKEETDLIWPVKKRIRPTSIQYWRVIFQGCQKNELISQKEVLFLPMLDINVNKFKFSLLAGTKVKEDYLFGLMYAFFI